MTTKISLYGITDEIRTLEKLVELQGGEVTKEVEELEKEVQTLLATKTDNFVNYINHLEDEIEAAKKRIAEFQTFIKYRENAIKTLKNYALLNLNILDQDKFRGDFATISKRKPVKKLDLIDVNKVPVEYITKKTELVVDKRALLKDLKEGNVTCEGARVIDGAESVTFKMNSADKK